jgi:hypothetical protein
MLHPPRFAERWRSHRAGGKRALREERHADRLAHLVEALLGGLFGRRRLGAGHYAALLSWSWS